MPKLGQSKIVKIVLPSSTPDDEAWVKLNMALTAGDVLDVRESSSGVAEMSAATVAKAITEWNFTDDSDNPVDITAESVRNLQARDFNHLSDLLLSTVRAVAEKPLDTGEKKAS